MRTIKGDYKAFIHFENSILDMATKNKAFILFFLIISLTFCQKKKSSKDKS